MKRIARITATLLTLSTLILVFSLPVFAASEESEEAPADASTTTVAPSSGLDPAVEVNDEEPVAAQADWTYRYLVPTGLLLAVVVAALTSIRYFTNVVRKRYRIVEE